MSEKRRVAVLGVYRSGSSAAAGALHHLGVEMGAPYFKNHYESLLLARKLRLWWREPQLQEMMPREARVRWLSEWILELESRNGLCSGAKHPLLSARGEDLLEAWGPDVRFIWTYRPQDESIASLQRLQWWPAAQSEPLQRDLWDRLTRFFAGRPHLRVDFADMIADPAREVARMIEFLEITPDPRHVDTAVRSVQYEPGGT
jgi:hypothetical protein